MQALPRRLNLIVIFALALLVLACGSGAGARHPTAAPVATEAPPPTETPRPTATPIALPTRNPDLKAAGAPPLNKDDCPPDYPIKGNIGDNGKLYHLKGGQSYNRTDPEVCFAAVADAVAAGFTAAAQ